MNDFAGIVSESEKNFYGPSFQKESQDLLCNVDPSNNLFEQEQEPHLQPILYIPKNLS